MIALQQQAEAEDDWALAHTARNKAFLEFRPQLSRFERAVLFPIKEENLAEVKEGLDVDFALSQSDEESVDEKAKEVYCDFRCL